MISPPAFYKNIFITLPVCIKNYASCANYSVLKMAEPQWRAEKSKLTKLSWEDKRKLYKIKDFVKVSSIEPWSEYFAKHENLSSDEEVKDIKINTALNKDLAQKVSMFRGDITKLEVDAIVNAANSMLRAGGGVDGAIHRAAGPHLQEECNTLGGCPTGEAKITGAYGLPARYVIQTVGPQDGSAPMLASCYKNCLALTQQEEYGIRTIAFPCISTGIYGFPNRLAAHIALQNARQFLEDNKHIDRIIFCTFMEVDVKIYESLMQRYFPVEK